MVGLVPYSYTCTSSIKLTLSLSISILVGITIIGIVENKIKILALMVPAGTPLGLVPLLVVIESVSYITRGISLGVRLGANMIAGHLLLKIISGFISKIKYV
jgi:F-type H+-transporting ATPase subunit a